MKKLIILLALTLAKENLSFAQSNSFPPNGFVGIGTINPAFKLDIRSPNNSGGTTRLRIADVESVGASAPGSFPTIEVLGARGDGNTTFGGRLALGFRRTDGLPLVNQTLGTILFGGQHGTETNFQAGKILYPSSIQGIAEGNFTGSNNMPVGIAFFTSSVGNDIGAPNYSYGVERMRVQSNGNVGIGTSSPEGILEVRRDQNDVTRLLVRNLQANTASSARIDLVTGTPNAYVVSGLNDNGGNPYYILGLGSGVKTAYFDAPEFKWRNIAGVTNLKINTDGNVLIGTEDAKGSAHKLAVNGSAIFTRAVVRQYGSWPDYVFEPSYRLPTLKEVEQFIKQHKHLPGVPSAKDVDATGLDLGESQAILLKKIEELTLYIIDQQKELEQLKDISKQIAALQKEIELLKSGSN